MMIIITILKVIQHLKFHWLFIGFKYIFYISILKKFFIIIEIYLFKSLIIFVQISDHGKHEKKLPYQLELLFAVQWYPRHALKNIPFFC